MNNTSFTILLKSMILCLRPSYRCTWESKSSPSRNNTHQKFKWPPLLQNWDSLTCCFPSHRKSAFFPGGNTHNSKGNSLIVLPHPRNYCTWHLHASRTALQDYCTKDLNYTCSSFMGKPFFLILASDISSHTLFWLVSNKRGKTKPDEQTNERTNKHDDSIIHYSKLNNRQDITKSLKTNKNTKKEDNWLIILF